MGKNEDKQKYFMLHPEDQKGHYSVDDRHNTHHKAPVNTEKRSEKRSAKRILKNGLRQLLASVAFLVIGIIVLNWSAFYEIAKFKVTDTLDLNEPSPFMELVETPEDTDTSTPGSNIIADNKVIQTSTDPEVQKKQIPPLDINIAPADNRLIIPRIDKNIPVVRVSSQSLIQRDWGSLENEIQGALQSGVVHYPGTAVPGQSGNIAITGHSSYFAWDPGRFKDVFALLHELVEGDRLVIYWDQKKYVYEVTDIDVVLPDDIEVLKQTPDDRLTLITCTPVGTNLKRLIVTAKPVEVYTSTSITNGRVLR